VQDVPNELGWGVFWWYPEARPVSGLGVWEGGRYGLFDQNGNLLPAATAFHEFIPSLAGDFNGDGAVDAADYVRWRRAGGSLEGYELWRMNFGLHEGAEIDIAVAVPEPFASAILGIPGALLSSRSRKRTTRSA
jgi:hypothetical protein